MRRIMSALIGFFDLSLARIAWLAVAAGLSYAAWKSIDAVGATVVTATATVSVLSTMPWLSGAGLRATRFAAGGLTGVSGFLLTLQLSLMAGPSGVADPRGFSGWMTIAVAFAGLGGLLCDERQARRDAAEQKRRDEIRARQHSELMTASSAKRRRHKGPSRAPALRRASLRDAGSGAEQPRSRATVRVLG